LCRAGPVSDLVLGSGGLTDHFNRGAWRPKHFKHAFTACLECRRQRPVIKPDGLEPATVASAASFS
jgi:hypothetical protein